MVFGFLASLAAPLLKPIAQTAWEGIKSIGRDLFTQASTAVKTLGQTLTDKASTIGQMGVKEKPVVPETPVSEELQTKMKVLQSQQSNMPLETQIVPYIPTQQMGQINDLYQNRYPSFNMQKLGGERFQNVYSQNFQNKMRIPRYAPITQKRNINDLYPNTFDRYQLPQRKKIQTTTSLMEKVFQQPEMNLNYQSQFERPSGMDYEELE